MISTNKLDENNLDILFWFGNSILRHNSVYYSVSQFLNSRLKQLTRLCHQTELYAVVLLARNINNNLICMALYINNNFICMALINKNNIAINTQIKLNDAVFWLGIINNFVCMTLIKIHWSPTPMCK